MSKSKLRERLDKVLKEYISAFEKKHDGEMEFAVVDDLMGIISFGDIYYIHISDIVEDIDNDYPKDIIFEWIDYSVDTHKKHDYQVNLSSYVKGVRYENKSAGK